MKRSLMLVMALLVAMATAAVAVINLDSSKVRTFTVGGVAQVTGDKSSATRALVDYQAKRITIFHAYGSGAFTPDNRFGEETFVVDVQAGTVTDGSGNLVATLTAQQKTNIEDALKAQRNTLENFLLNINATQGTQTNW